MASAQSLEAGVARSPYRGPSTHYRRTLSCFVPGAYNGADPERLRLGRLAMKAPVLGEAVVPGTWAWQYALLMLDCYAIMPRGEEAKYMSCYAVNTVEEAAEGQMQDCMPERSGMRLINVAAKAALNALNWASAQPVPTSSQPSTVLPARA